MAQTEPQRAISPRAWALMGLLALIWGGSFLSNKVALTELGVLTTVAFRVGGAALALWTYILLRGLSVPKGRPWLKTCLIMGVLNNIVPFSLIVWGQTHIPTGLAGILNAATTVFGVGLAAMAFPDERLTLRKTVGVALGLAGVVAAVGPAVLVHFDITSLGQLAILGAAFSYGVSGIYGRRALMGIRPEVGAAGMLTASACVMVPAALMFEGVPGLHYGPTTWAAVAYLALLSSALAYILFYSILQTAGAGNLSLVTLLVAPVAVVLGAVVYHEALPVTAYLGLVLLAMGMLVIDGKVLTIFRVKSARP
ncbi:MAG: DMT family transporter [Alphaproteobacteria bacterium]